MLNAKIKIRTLLNLVALLSYAMLSSASAIDNYRPKISPLKPLTLGVANPLIFTKDKPPLCILRNALIKLNYELKIIKVPVLRYFKMINDGDLPLIIYFQATWHKNALSDLNVEPVEQVLRRDTFHAFTLKKNGLNIRDLSDLAGYRVGYLATNIRLVEAYQLENSIAVKFVDHQALTQGLLSGRIDIALNTKQVGMHDIRNYHIEESIDISNSLGMVNLNIALSKTYFGRKKSTILAREISEEISANSKHSCKIRSASSKQLTVPINKVEARP